MNNASFNAHDIRKVCEKKACISFSTKSKEFNGWVLINDKKFTRVTVPKGRKYLPPGTYKSIANQLKLSLQDFDKFVDCSMKSKEYFDKFIK